MPQSNDAAVPLRPVYPFGAPGEPVELYSGDIAVGWAGAHPGRIFADMAGDLQVRWHLTDSDVLFDFGEVNLDLQLADVGPTTVPARLNSRSGAGEIMDATIGSSDAMCERVIAHFTNLPSIFPWGAGRWRVSGAGWELTLEGRLDHSKVYSEVTKSLNFVVTHVGELRRANGRSFPASKANRALEAFQVALSCALGRYIAPVAPVGFDAAVRRVWEQWASWRCDPVSGYLPWWHHNDGEDLQAFVKLFMAAWLNREEHNVTWHLARHLIAAQHRGTTLEAKIMLVHAALEYLAWVTYVLSGNRSRKKYGDATAEDHLRELLQAASIPTKIPSDLVAMQKRARAIRRAERKKQPTQPRKPLPDGPQVLTWLRNRLVHPKDAGEPYRIEDLVSDAWRLVTEYGELLLLHRIGYKGKYRPKTDNGEWVESVPVPWAT
jgi:hypothetical protein